jgi:drug/metabolite transporter (DMT)-like permease
MSSVSTVSNAETNQRFGPSEWGMSGLIAIIWGSSFLWIAIAIEDVDVTVVPLARCLFGTLALLTLRRARIRIERADWPRFIFLGFSWMALPFLLYPIAEKTVNTSITGMLNGALPIVTTVITAVWVRTMPSGFRIFAVLIGGAGIALISLSSVGENKGADAKGVLLLIAALISYAIAANTARPMQSKYGSLGTMLWIEIFGTLWSVPFGINGLWNSQLTASAVGSLLVLGAIGTGLAFAIYAVLLGRAGTVRGMIGIFFTPIVSTILGITFRDDRLSPGAVIGMGIVIVGAVLTSRPERIVLNLDE